jgi:hypothetical protein
VLLLLNYKSYFVGPPVIKVSIGHSTAFPNSRPLSST